MNRLLLPILALGIVATACGGKVSPSAASVPVVATAATAPAAPADDYPDHWTPAVRVRLLGALNKLPTFVASTATVQRCTETTLVSHWTPKELHAMNEAGSLALAIDGIALKCLTANGPPLPPSNG